MKTFVNKISFKRFLKYLAIAFCFGISLLFACLLLLPVIIGSNASQSRIQKLLSSSMKRQVVWADLKMTWSNGLSISGLKLGEGPPPLLKAEVDQIMIAPSVGRDSNGRFGIDLALKVKNVRSELVPASPKPQVPPSKDPLTLLAESIQNIQKLDYSLPVDLRVMIEVTPLQVLYRTPDPSKQMRLQDFSVRFSMPSLASKPIIADVEGKVSVGKREMGKVTFAAKISDLVTKKQRIHLASALFAVTSTAPGTKVTFSGGLSQADGFLADCKINIPALLTVAQAFLPANLPKIDGNMDIQIRGKADQNRDIRAALAVDGLGLAASGGSLKTSRVGPLDMKLQQQISTDHLRQRVDFPAGKVSITGLLDAAWSASVDKPAIPGRSLELNLGSVRLDLAKAISVARPFLPPDFPVKDLVGEAFIQSLSLKLKGPANNGNIATSGVGVKLPQIWISQKTGELKVVGFDLLLEKLECPLIAKQPNNVKADLIWSLKQLALSGSQPLNLQGARGKVGLAVNDLNLKSGSPRKVSASVAVTQAFDLDKASLGIQLGIEKVHEQLRFSAHADEKGDIKADLTELIFSVASIQSTLSGKKLSAIPFSANFSVSGLHIPVDNRGRPTLQRAAANISAGNFLQLAAEAFVAETFSQKITSKGTVQLDVKKAMQFVAPFLPGGLKGEGLVNSAWNFTAPLPEKSPVVEKHPLRSAKAALSLFERFELSLKLDNVSAVVPGAKGAIRITGLQTKPDMHILSSKNGATAKFDGGILFAGVSGLPGTAEKLPSQQGSFAFNGELVEWKSLRLSEKIRIEPLAVSQNAEINVSRIDSLFDEKEPFGTAALIKRLDATAVANIEASLSRELKQILPGIDLAGSVNGSIRADLAAGKELAVRGSFKSKDFGVSLANGTKIEGIRSDIAINRVFALAAVSKGEQWTPLSNALVRPAPSKVANPGAVDVAARINDDLHGDIHGARSFTIQRVTAKMPSGTPLVLTSLEGDLLFSQEKTGLSFFQADLLGGTLLARGVIDLRPQIPLISLGGSFSNLDIIRLLPKETKKRPGDQDAEITGEMNFSVPLTPEERELLEQLRLSINIRKIGSNTIERALFSLDPYERSEQVVAQRKLLKIGTLKGLRANAVDGAFSMEGEAEIKGVGIDLPKVDRLRISELPLRKEFLKNRQAVISLKNILDLVRADTLVVGPKGELSLKRRMYAE